jgi:hypothetical protein
MGMTDTGDARISPREMAVLIEQGAARPLMTGYDPVPVRHAQRWWHVPADAAPQAPYVPASPAQCAVFDELAERLALADAALTHTTTADGDDAADDGQDRR